MQRPFVCDLNHLLHVMRYTQPLLYMHFEFTSDCSDGKSKGYLLTCATKNSFRTTHMPPALMLLCFILFRCAEIPSREKKHEENKWHWICNNDMEDVKKILNSFDFYVTFRCSFLSKLLYLGYYQPNCWDTIVSHDNFYSDMVLFYWDISHFHPIFCCFPRG